MYIEVVRLMLKYVREGNFCNVLQGAADSSFIFNYRDRQVSCPSFARE